MAGAHDVFISYARADRERVRILADALARRGMVVWWDTEILPGESFHKSIANALAAAKAVVVVWSRTSIDSDWVLAEADDGKRRKILVPALIDRIEIPLGFRSTQAADLVGWAGDLSHAGWRNLAETVARVVAGEAAASETNSGRVAPVDGASGPPEKRRWTAWAAGAAALLLLAGGGYYAKRFFDDRHFAELLERIDAAIIQQRFPDAKTALDEAERFRPGHADLIRAAARYSEELRRHNASRNIPLVPGIRDCADCPILAEIPAGSFLMGSPDGESPRYEKEGPQRRITLQHPFLMGRFEVTVGEFRAFVRKSGYKPVAACATYKFGAAEWDPERPDRFVNWEKPDFTTNENHPVVCVSWFDARAYVAWLSRETGKTYRLPSEAEWEYAARAGATGRYYWSDHDRDTCDHANAADSTIAGRVPSNWERFDCSDKFPFTAPVGRYKPNAFGLYDMLGNAWEWVEDCVNDDHHGAPGDGRPRTDGDCNLRILRGGSWISKPQDVRLASRGKNLAKTGFNATGFRVVREK